MKKAEPDHPTAIGIVPLCVLESSYWLPVTRITGKHQENQPQTAEVLPACEIFCRSSCSWVGDWMARPLVWAAAHHFSDWHNWHVSDLGFWLEETFLIGSSNHAVTLFFRGMLWRHILDLTKSLWILRPRPWRPTPQIELTGLRPPLRRTWRRWAGSSSVTS